MEPVLAVLRHFWLVGAAVTAFNYVLFRESVPRRVAARDQSDVVRARRLFTFYQAASIALCLLLYALQFGSSDPRIPFLFQRNLGSPSVVISWVLTVGASTLLLGLLWRSPRGLIIAQLIFNGALPGENARSLATTLALVVNPAVLLLLVMR